MKRMALNFICKNEAHIITRMLNSTLPITDLIVAVDTGSTDNTIDIIETWGKKHAVPTFIFERPFDNFGNSRNFALKKLIETVDQLDWNKEETWGFWIDCDEVMIFLPAFNKKDIAADLYFVTGLFEDMAFSKQIFFSLSKEFYWEGPVHECLQSASISTKISVAHCDTITIAYDMKGASWKSDLVKKYLTYVEKLKEYIAQGHCTFRWLLYLADSYYAAAINCKDPVQRKVLHTQASESYANAATLTSLERHEQARLFSHMAENQMDLNEPWPSIKKNLLIAYKADKRFAEPIESIIEHYIQSGQWETALIYSSFAIAQYHLRQPKGLGVADVKPSLYQWRVLFFHYTILMHLKQYYEARQIFKLIKKQQIDHPNYFSEKDAILIYINSPVTLLCRIKIESIKRSLVKRVTSGSSISILNNLIPQI